MSKLKLKKGDTVKVISGEARGQQGKIISIDVNKLRAIVEGVNLVSKSEKPNAKNTNGGIVKKEGPIHLSNLMFVEGGKTVRIGRKLNEKTQRNERVSNKSKEAVK
ncbi:MAG TPA: 50S ribosomal protein L24 [Bacteroidia bacterium]|nr:50S ribosomal protein L24 [Bacteroidia bacterium]